MPIFLELLPPSHKKLIATVQADISSSKEYITELNHVNSTAVQFPVVKQRLGLNHDQYQVWDTTIKNGKDNLPG